MDGAETLDACLVDALEGTNPEFKVGVHGILHKHWHVDAAQRLQTDAVILEREYELLYIEGRVDEMVRAPYDEIHRRMGMGRRLSTALKRAFPHLHRWYRKRKGYLD